MPILYFLLIFGPGIISATIQCWMEKIPYKSFLYFIRIFIYSFLIQCFVLVVFYLRGLGANVPEFVFESLGNIVKYTLLSLAVAVLLPGILSFINKFQRSKK